MVRVGGQRVGRKPSAERTNEGRRERKDRETKRIENNAAKTRLVVGDGARVAEVVDARELALRERQRRRQEVVEHLRPEASCTDLAQN